MAKVAFIGLGVMGAPMAGHLVTKGRHDVVVFNRTAAKAAGWVARHPGTRAAATPAEAAAGADFVLACVGNDSDLHQVTLGANGAFEAMGAGAVFIDHTTSSAEMAHELASAAAARGFAALDAPVSGGQAGAEAATLTIMAGGEPEAFAQAEPVMLAYARAATLIGPSGSGQLAKMVNQIAIAGLLQALAEAIQFAKNSGLDVERVMTTIAKGAAQSWQLDNRWKSMAEGRFDFGFAVDWMRKDLAFCLSEARRNGSSLPVTALVDQFYAEVQEIGGARWDSSSLIARLDVPRAS